MVRVKICGITSELDAQRAARAGAWALGFIFYKKSPRFISPFKAKKIIDSLPPFITPVGVFVNHKAGAVRDIITHCGLRAVQLHGDEDHHFCHRLKRYNVKIIKVFRVCEGFDPKVVENFKVDAFMFDTYDQYNFGGTGKTFDWKLLKQVKSANDVPIILSGGLNNQNVIEPVKRRRQRRIIFMARLLPADLIGRQKALRLVPQRRHHLRAPSVHMLQFHQQPL